MIFIWTSLAFLGLGRGCQWHPPPAWISLFFFFIFKKIQKYMSVLKIFENGPRSPAQGRQGSCRPSNGRQDLNVIFFKICKEVPDRGCVEGGGPVAPSTSDRGLSSPPPTIDRGLPPYISPGLHASIPFSFELK